MNATATSSIDPKNAQPPNRGGVNNAGQNTSNPQGQNTRSTNTNTESVNKSNTTSSTQNPIVQIHAVNTQEQTATNPENQGQTTTTNTQNGTEATKNSEFVNSIDEANKKICSVTNTLQVIGNSISFITKFPILNKFKDIGDKLGQWTTKLFLLGNGITNALKQLTFRNYTSLLGYLVYVFNGLFIPQNKAYMVNGFGVGLTQLANQVNNINGRSTFNSPIDHFTHLFTGLGKLIKEFRNPLKAFKEGKPVVGAAGGLAALAGSTLWAITGDEKSAAVVRDGGGLALDLEQVSKHQIKYKRKNYVTSGAFYIVGTVFDLLSKFAKPLEPYCRPLCFLFDGVARYFQGVSERKKEMSNEHLTKAEVDEIEANTKAKNPSYLALVKDMFSKAKSKIENASILDNAPDQGDFASAAA